MSEQPPAGYGYGGQPPSPPGGARPGELLDRFVARFIDGILVAIAYGILSAILTPIFLGGWYDSAGEVFFYSLILAVGFTAIALGYFGLMESSRGQTLGKMVMKLRTVGPDGGNPTLEQALKRNIFYATNLLAIIPWVGAMLGGLLGLVAVILIAVGINNDTVNRQAWHDQFAGGTRVLKVG